MGPNRAEPEGETGRVQKTIMSLLALTVLVDDAWLAVVGVGPTQRGRPPNTRCWLTSTIVGPTQRGRPPTIH
jgi:hypothetical protein